MGRERLEERLSKLVQESAQRRAVQLDVLQVHVGGSVMLRRVGAVALAGMVGTVTAIVVDGWFSGLVLLLSIAVFVMRKSVWLVGVFSALLLMVFASSIPLIALMAGPLVY